MSFADDLLVSLSTLLFLGVASLYEWRTKRVPNWLTLGALGLATLWQIASGGWIWLIGVVWAICFAAWRAGALGGGDAKVLMTLGALRPDRIYFAWLVVGWMAWYSVVLIRRQPGPIGSRLQRTVALVTGAMQVPRRVGDLKDPFVSVVMVLTAIYWLTLALLRALPVHSGPTWIG